MQEMQPLQTSILELEKKISLHTDLLRSIYTTRITTIKISVQHDDNEPRLFECSDSDVSFMIDFYSAWLTRWRRQHNSLKVLEAKLLIEPYEFGTTVTTGSQPL